MKLLNIKINYSLSSPWIIPDITLRTILSLSIRTVFCIIATTLSNSLLLPKIFFKLTFSAFVPPLNALTTRETTYILWHGRRSLVSNASCLYFVNFSVVFAPMLLRFGHTMTQIQIFLSVFNSKIKSGLLTVVVFCRWNTKSHTSFALFFSSTVPLFHCYSYQMPSWWTNSWYFKQVTARIISACLFLVRYSLFASLVHPATRWSIVSEWWVHILQLPSSVSLFAFFHDLVSTIYSNVLIIAAILSGLRFWDNHRWHAYSCPLYNLLCCSFVPYSSTIWFLTRFFNFSFKLFHTGFHPPSISFSSILMLLS